MKTTLIRNFAAAALFGGLASTAWALTPAEETSVLFMKQEEKLARDVYQLLHAQWGAKIFSNIAASEQKHMNAVDTLIVANGLEDATPEAAGEFTYPELEELYAQLVEQGSASLADALAVGVAIETEDIADLEDALNVTEDAATRRVFTNLLNGSLRHLAAFNNFDESTVGTGTGKGGKKAANAKAAKNKGAKKNKNNKKNRKGGGNKGKGGNGKG
ncbi:MAG: DUF2202 domain-containing protein [Akkermansiaceae bacterium]|nr:DUF2202 domain-containing protein [Akkermansiaceae bacterium]MCP5544618.1 DUF2202 domain-containing protein [Akkermansiaceae bacterium]